MDGSNDHNNAANGNAYTNTAKNDEQHGSNNNDDTINNNLLTTVNSTEGSNTTTDNNDPLASSINSTMPLIDTNNEYHDLTDEQLQEFAKIVSPKVSDLLHEQEMLMVDLLDTSAWSSDSDDSSNNDNSKKQSKNKKKRRGQDDDDSMNDEWDQLEVAQLNLKDELDAAALNYADMMMYDGEEKNGGNSSISREEGSSNINNGMRYSE